MFAHKIYHVGSNVVSSSHKVTFIFPVFIIHNNHKPPGFYIFNSIFNAPYIRRMQKKWRQLF